MNVSRLVVRIHLVRKEDLTPEQLATLEARLCHSEAIEGECGPTRAWRAYQRYLYAFVEDGTNRPIAIAEASGRPTSAPGWWIDPEYRRKGYGYELVELLAGHLKMDGVTKIGTISIQTPGGAYDEQSRKLVQRLRTHIPDGDG